MSNNRSGSERFYLLIMIFLCTSCTLMAGGPIKADKVKFPDAYSVFANFTKACALDARNSLVVARVKKAGGATYGLTAFVINQRGQVKRSVDLGVANADQATLIELPRTNAAPNVCAENRFVVFYATKSGNYMHLHLIPLSASGEPTRAPVEFYQFDIEEGHHFGTLSLVAAARPGSIVLGLSTSSDSYSGGVLQSQGFTGITEIASPYLVLLKATRLPLPNDGYDYIGSVHTPVWNGSRWLMPITLYDYTGPGIFADFGLGMASFPGGDNTPAEYQTLVAASPSPITPGGDFILESEMNGTAVSTTEANLDFIYRESKKYTDADGNQKGSVKTWARTVDAVGDFDATRKKIKLKAWKPAYNLATTETLNYWIETFSPPVRLKNGDWFTVRSCCLVIKDSTRPATIPYRYITQAYYLSIDPLTGKVTVRGECDPSHDWGALGYGSAQSFFTADGSVRIFHIYTDYNSGLPGSNHNMAFISRLQ